MLKFNWNETWVGYSLGFVGLLIALVQGLLIRITIPKLGQKWSIYTGLLLYTFGLILFAFADKGWMMFIFLVPYCMGGICGPALQGVISSQVPPTEQGELQGALTSLISVTSIIGPPVMTNLFAWFTKPGAPVHFPGAPFLAGAVLTFTSILLSRQVLEAFGKNKK